MGDTKYERAMVDARYKHAMKSNFAEEVMKRIGQGKYVKTDHDRAVRAWLLDLYENPHKYHHSKWYHALSETFDEMPNVYLKGKTAVERGLLASRFAKKVLRKYYYEAFRAGFRASDFIGRD